MPLCVMGWLMCVMGWLILDAAVCNGVIIGMVLSEHQGQ